MTISIDIKWFRALVAVIALALIVTAAAGCSVKPCTCHCICTNGQTFCKGHDDASAAGTANCENNCSGAGNPPRIFCDDDTRGITHPPPDGGTPPPVCSGEGEAFRTNMYCETCTLSSDEKDISASGCTDDEAEANAMALARADGEDCSVELGNCSASP